MRAHSQDLRQQVLRAVDEGKSRAEIIERFQVSQATIKRYLKQRRETGNVLATSHSRSSQRQRKGVTGGTGKAIGSPPWYAPWQSIASVGNRTWHAR